ILGATTGQRYSQGEASPLNTAPSLVRQFTHRRSAPPGQPGQMPSGTFYPTIAALQRETRAIPIVFLIVSDPLGDGVVVSLSRQGGNSTGFVNVEASMGGKWLQLLSEIAPSTKRVALLFNSKTAPGGGSFFSTPFEDAARVMTVDPIRSADS